MSVTKIQIRRGTYYDSVVLMQLQASLQKLPGIVNAGVMMGTTANKDLLKQQGLLTAEAEASLPDDLIVSIEAVSDTAAETALAQVDGLLSQRPAVVEQEYMPKSLEAAVRMLPEASWVLVSVPGQYAAGVARAALALQKNVFLYSDNVLLEDEISLKKQAAELGLLVMGPDCGTAIVNGVGLGFANRVRRGPIGLVGASGTGLQQVSARIHQLGSGITHALGTGGRDLSQHVGGMTAKQALDLLRRDTETKVIVMISKPPSPEVAATLLRNARATEKPVVVNFIGYTQPTVSTKESQLYFAASLDEAAELAVALANASTDTTRDESSSLSTARKSHLNPLLGGAGVGQRHSVLAQTKNTQSEPGNTSSQKFVRGLFSGGTLAYECLLMLQGYLPAVYSNIAMKKEHALNDPMVSQGHTILDLGADEFTQGRPHPMLDNTIRLLRLAQEANDPTVSVILLDVVLGDGAHPDPAGEIAPAISEARALAKAAGRELEVVVVVIGTDEDPQNMAAQIEQLKSAGAHVETSNRAAAANVGQRLQEIGHGSEFPPVDLKILQQPFAAINVGLESFAASVFAQDTPVIHVDWHPPAGGNEKLMSILERMKGK